MQTHIGQIPTKVNLTTKPAMFQVGDFVERLDKRSSSIGTVIQILIAERAYGMKYKYLIQIDTDMYIIDEFELDMHEPFKGVVD